MNEFQDALNRLYGGALSYVFNSHMNKDRAKRDYAMDKNKIQELVDRATPKKPIIVKEIGDYDEDGFSKSYEYEVTKCEGCNTVLVDLETDEIDRSGEPFCFNCGQATDWSKDE